MSAVNYTKWPAFYHIWLLITHKKQLLRCTLSFYRDDILFPYKYINTMHHLHFVTAKTLQKSGFSAPSSWTGCALTWWAFTRHTKEQNEFTLMKMSLLLDCKSDLDNHWTLVMAAEVKRVYRCCAVLIIRLEALGN